MGLDKKRLIKLKTPTRNVSYVVYFFAAIVHREFLSFFFFFHILILRYITTLEKKVKPLTCDGIRSPSCLDAVLENLFEHCEDAYWLWHDVLNILDFISPNYQSWINEINFYYLDMMFSPLEQPR